MNINAQIHDLKETNLPSLGITYDHKPYSALFFDPIDRGDIKGLRDSIERQISQQPHKEIIFRSYLYEPKNIQNYDCILDSIQIRIKPDQLVYLAYHTTTDDLFLTEFMPLATEIFTLNQILPLMSQKLPEKKNIIQRIDSTIDAYLENNHQMPWLGFQKGILSKIPLSERSFEFMSDLSHDLILYLGALAVMNKNGMQADQYFSELGKRRIYPMKREKESKLFNIIKNSLV